MKFKKKRPHAKPQRREGNAKIFFAIIFPRSASIVFMNGAEAASRLCVRFFCSIIGLTGILNFGGFAFAAEKPNFTGTWVFDQNKSYGFPQGLEQTMTITHTGDQIKLEARQKSVRGEFDFNESYTLDAKEGEFTPQQQGPDAKGKRKAYWLPNNKGILIEDTITTNSPEGPKTQLITRKWLLSPDGQTLTVDYYFDGPRGSFESKRVFVKKK
jgi:hypothetical protein